MAVVTKQELEDASVDAQTLEDVINGAADLNGDGTVTSRLGQTLKTVAKSIQDINTMGVVLDAVSAFAAEVGAPASSILIDDEGNVGIGTSSPSSQNSNADDLVIGDATSNRGLTVLSGSTSEGGIYFADGDADNRGMLRYFHTADILTISTAGTEAMRIDSSGNVLVGKQSSSTFTPGIEARANGLFIATVDGSDVAIFNRQTSDGRVIQIRKDDVIEGFIGTGGSSLTIGQGTTEAMRIDSSGNVLVGKNTIGSSTNGCELNNDGLIRATKSSGPAVILNRNTTGGDIVEFKQANVNVGSIAVTGSATAYNTSSDHRLKEDLQPIATPSDKVKQLKPVNFAWKVDGTRVDGFIAHELAEVIPEAVTGEKDAMKEVVIQEAVEAVEAVPAVLWTEEDELPEGVQVGDVKTPAVEAVEAVEEITEMQPDYQGIDQSKIVPLLTAALQEVMQKNESLEARLSALEAIQ